MQHTEPAAGRFKVCLSADGRFMIFGVVSLCSAGSSTASDPASSWEPSASPLTGPGVVLSALPFALSLTLVDVLGFAEALPLADAALPLAEALPFAHALALPLAHALAFTAGLSLGD